MTTNDDLCTAAPRRPLAPCPLTVRDVLWALPRPRAEEEYHES